MESRKTPARSCWPPLALRSLMVPPFSPELRLAAACAMWPPSDRRIEVIRPAAAGPLGWPCFLRVARRHQVIGLVHDGLTRARTNVPPEIAREIGAQAATLVRENLAMARLRREVELWKRGGCRGPSPGMLIEMSRTDFPPAMFDRPDFKELLKNLTPGR